MINFITPSVLSPKNIRTLAIDSSKLSSDVSNGFVRRPINGISIKPDTYACILYNGSINTSSPLKNDKYDHNLLIQQFSLSRTEKSQVIETFDGHYVYFFGERAPNASVSALLLDTETFEWFQQFDMNYEKVYRGTQNATRKAPISIVIDGLQLVGYITNVSYSQSATQDPYMVNMNFNMIVEKIVHLSDITAVKVNKVDSDKESVLRKLSNQNQLSNVLSNKFKSVADEIAFLANAGQLKSSDPVQTKLQEIVNDYRNKNPAPTSYFEAYPNEYLSGKFGNLTNASDFDVIIEYADNITAAKDLDFLSKIVSTNRVAELTEEYKMQANLVNQQSENVGLYIDSVIQDQTAVDIIGDLFGSGVTADSLLRSKQSASMAASLSLYGLQTLTSNLSEAVDFLDNTLTSVRVYALGTVEGIFGPDREVQEDQINTNLGEFI